MLSVTLRCYLHIIFVLTVVNSPQKAHDLEIIKKSMKKTVKHRKTRAKQVTLAHERRNSGDTRGT